MTLNLVPQVPPAPGVREQSVAGAIVLVVDDSPLMRTYHSAILTDLGCTVREAENGYAATELVLVEWFDLILADVNMPIMDGYQFAEQVRCRAIRPQAPIIMISTESKAPDADEAFARGANTYLVKPAAPAELAAIVRLMLGAFVRTEGERP